MTRADSKAQQEAKQPVEDPVGGTFLKEIRLLGRHFCPPPDKYGQTENN